MHRRTVVYKITAGQPWHTRPIIYCARFLHASQNGSDLKYHTWTPTECHAKECLSIQAKAGLIVDLEAVSLLQGLQPWNSITGGGRLLTHRIFLGPDLRAKLQLCQAVAVKVALT